MKTFVKLLVLMLGGMVVLSGCSTISSMLAGGSEDAAAAVEMPASDAPSADEVVAAPAGASDPLHLLRFLCQLVTDLSPKRARRERASRKFFRSN